MFPMSIYPILVFFSLFSVIFIGIYTEWSVIISFLSVVGEFRYLTQTLWEVRKEDLNLKAFLGHYQWLSHYFGYFCFLVSILVLIDRIPSSWRMLTLGNRLQTSRYPNTASLVFNVTLAYLLSIPNLVTLTIGYLQAYNTSVLVVLSHSTLCKLGGFLGVSYYFWSGNINLAVALIIGIFSGLWAFSGVTLYYLKGNYVNLGVSVICWLFALYQEWDVYRRARQMDERRNGNLVRLIGRVTQLTRADTLLLGDTILLREGEITPAGIQVERIRCLRETADPDYQIATYDDRESSGEDVSRKFTVGASLVAHRKLTRPDIEITGRITDYVTPEVAMEAQLGDSVPRFLDRVRIIADLVGFLLLILISLSVSASALAKDENPEKVIVNQIFTHLVAAAISANVLIPSMRMTLIYHVYNLFMAGLYQRIKVVRYGCLPKVSGIDRVIFDKTGTLTEEDLRVGKHYLYPMTLIGVFRDISEQTGWTPEELQFALTMANNECNINPKTDRVWGTSPEESEMVNYWRDHYPDLSFTNPLRDTGVLTFCLGGEQRRLEITDRKPYRFGVGKLAVIIIHGDKDRLTLRVRQDGTSHIIGVLPSQAREWSETCERDDPRRSISIAFQLDQSEETEMTSDTVHLLSIYSFENPLRPDIVPLIQFIASQGLPPYILTGDGAEAAEEVSRRAGFPSQYHRLCLANQGDQGFGCLTRPDGRYTISIEGRYLESWLQEDPDSATTFLNQDNEPKVIYRASKTIKEQVAKAISRGLYVGDAANDALAIQHSYLGVALRHGADICRLNADLTMISPPDLMGLLEKNGFRDMFLAGGERLLEDVCWMGGLTAGCLVVGLHRHGFTFLAGSPLYLDTWKPLPMLFVSSLQYTISVLAYASADCESQSHCWRCLASHSARWHILGLMVGMTVAWTVKNCYPEGNFSYLVLHALDIIILTKHSWHCLVQSRPRIAPRRSGGLFGNQRFGQTPQEQRFGFVLSILDSVPARCLLYGVFTLLGEGYF